MHRQHLSIDLSKNLQAPCVVVNADDFGLNASVNKAIAEAFKQRLISSTTMITNMPGFEEACEISSLNRLHGRIGVHLNLMEGQSLTEGIRVCNRFCNASGFFHGSLEGTHFNFSSSEREAVIIELAAQIEMLEQRGITPTHMDSHHHFHTSIAFLPIIIKLARMKSIPAIRLNNNCCEPLPIYKKVYKILYNMTLYLYGMAKTDYFCTIDDVERVGSSLRKGIIEVMVHPTYSGPVLVDSENGQPLIEQLRQLGKYSMLSYATLKSSRRPKFLNIDKRTSL
jgi:predicted glycoside hydrolase/deacetylase ChbG (UPF0249 family)